MTQAIDVAFKLSLLSLADILALHPSTHIFISLIQFKVFTAIDQDERD